MSVVTGFLKVATANHQDGSQFVIADTEPAAYSAPNKSMAPSGLEVFDPSGKNSKSQGGKKHIERIKATNYMMGKMATSAAKEEDMVGQLKWDTTTPGSLTQPGSDPESAQQYNIMKRAKKRGAKYVE